MFAVFHLEWIRACRRSLHHVYRSAYAAVLLAEFLFYIWGWATRSYFQRLLDPHQHDEIAAEIAWEYLCLFAGQHFVLIAIVAPTLAAGSITDEKMRGTLSLVLTTRLTSTDLVLGKWLAIVSQVFLLSMPVAPLLVFLGTLTNVAPLTMLAWGAESLLLTGTLTAIALLTSVLSRRTTTAVFTVYTLCGLMGIVIWVTNAARVLQLFSLDVPLGPAHDPVGRLLPGALLACVNALCLTLAVVRLRPVHAAQLTAAARRAPLSTWLRRPAVSDAPLRWKERHVGELGLLSFLRRLPRWLLVGCVAALGLLMTYWTIHDDFAVLLHGLGFMGTVGLLVAVRASGVVTGERERQTWESLLLTPLEPYHLLRGKLWGIIDGVRPYLVAYLLPALAVAVYGGVWPTFCLVYCWIATWGLLYYLAALGVNWSVRLHSSWQSLLYTLSSAAISIFFRSVLFSLPIALISTACVGLILVPGLPATFFMPRTLASWYAFLLVVWVTPALVRLFGVAEELLQDAEKEVRRKERVMQETGPDKIRSLEL